MRILLTGASGFLGSALMQALAKEGHELVLTSRHPPRGITLIPSARWHAMDFTRALSPDAWQPLLDGVDVVINAAGIFREGRGQNFEDVHHRAPAALFRAAREAGVRRIVQISAIGVDEGTSAYHRSKKKADDALAAMPGEWVILRPSLIIGGDGASWLFFRALSLLPVVPVVGDGRQRLQPIAIEDVTEAVIRAMHEDAAVGRRIDLVGREALTLRDYLHRLAQWQGRRRFRAMRMSYGASALLASLSTVLGDFPLTREAIAMLRETRRYDTGACRECLGFEPRGLSEVLRERPVTRAELQAVRFYFLLPLLRLSLALVWILTGIVSMLPGAWATGLPLLAQLGLTGTIGMAAQAGAALLDVALGLMLLLRLHVRQAATVQIGLIVGYSALLTFVAPQMWADPFGPLAKNIPLLAATLIVRQRPE